MFLRLYERGLAYRDDAMVNWCPQDRTVLANEQVVEGRCERCGTEVIKRALTQWFFRITDYAQRLLDDMDQLEPGWPAEILTMQRNWIGHSEGAHIDFTVEGHPEPVRIFTTRPDTLFGATFFVLAFDAPLAAQLCAPECRDVFDSYARKVSASTDIERLATDRTKTGVFLGRYGVNPANGERIPVYASDYVLATYGTGAVMAVPAHDQRDLDFARALGIPVRTVVDTGEADPARTGVATTGAGVLICSGHFTGRSSAEARAAIVADLVGAGYRRGRGHLSAAGLAVVAAEILGHTDSHHPLRRVRAGAGARRPVAGPAAGQRLPAAPGRRPRTTGQCARVGQRVVPALRRGGPA
nr:class I tRNA ligase family protein [Nocardia jiangxiensis]